MTDSNDRGRCEDEPERGGGRQRHVGVDSGEAGGAVIDHGPRCDRARQRQAEPSFAAVSAAFASTAGASRPAVTIASAIAAPELSRTSPNMAVGPDCAGLTAASEDEPKSATSRTRKRCTTASTVSENSGRRQPTVRLQCRSSCRTGLARRRSRRETKEVDVRRSLAGRAYTGHRDRRSLGLREAHPAAQSAGRPGRVRRHDTVRRHRQAGQLHVEEPLQTR